MYRILLYFSLLLLLPGCGLKETTNNPSKQVELFLARYQNLDDVVMIDLNNAISEENFNDYQSDLYKNIMKRHYKNLKYQIKHEEINGNKAMVTVDIEVFDYSRVMAESILYLKEHQDQNNNNNQEQFIDYQLSKLKAVNDKVNYTLELNVIKINNQWRLEPLSLTDLDKINGMFIY